MEQDSITRLLHPYAKIDDRQAQQISIYIDVLVKWNSRMNLTAVRDPEEMVTRHFGESLFAASRFLTPEWSGSIIDVGSGAGFPGLPLALYAPGAAVTLMESHGKKAAFLNEVIFALGLKNAKVWAGRAEAYSSQAELVTMRAVERFERVVAVASSLVAPGGRLALLIGGSQVALATKIVTELRWSAPINVPGGRARVLLVGTKPVKVE